MSSTARTLRTGRWVLPALLLALGSCRSREQVQDDERVAAECEAGTCVDIVSGNGGLVGVEEDGHYNDMSCRLIVRRPGGRSVPAFEERIGSLGAGSLVPLQGGLAKVERCYKTRDSFLRENRTVAVLRVDLQKEYASLTPATDNVIIAIGGETLLDGVKASARVQLDSHGLPRPDSVWIEVDHPPPGQDTAFSLHEGAMFSWAGHVVELVRIVGHDAWVAEWVEIAIRS
jgi:hypothetical protein